MKKVSRFLILAAVAIMLMAGSAMASPFGPHLEITGWVNPNYASLDENVVDGTTTLDVEYLFSVDNAIEGAEMNLLSLEFERDVFASVNSFTVTNPDDWAVSEFDEPFTGFSRYEISSAGTTGTTLGKGDKLVISAKLTLFNDALTNADLWDEGQIWGQSWVALSTLGLGDGGSTAPVPEPATLFLLGSGLAGLALYGRRKKQYK